MNSPLPSCTQDFVAAVAVEVAAHGPSPSRTVVAGTAIGRAAELAATYDSPTGLLSLHPGEAIGVCQTDEAAIVALALRRVGCDREADALLGQADALITALYRRGQVPTWVNGDAAAVWAAQGKSGKAIDALERALNRGWAHAARADLPRLGDEPVLATLRGIPRFEAVRARYASHYARERAETLHSAA